MVLRLYWRWCTCMLVQVCSRSKVIKMMISLATDFTLYAESSSECTAVLAVIKTQLYNHACFSRRYASLLKTIFEREWKRKNQYRYADSVCRCDSRWFSQVTRKSCTNNSINYTRKRLELASVELPVCTHQHHIYAYILHICLSLCMLLCFSAYDASLYRYFVANKLLQNAELPLPFRCKDTLKDSQQTVLYSKVQSVQPLCYILRMITSKRAIIPMK